MLHLHFWSKTCVRVRHLHMWLHNYQCGCVVLDILVSLLVLHRISMHSVCLAWWYNNMMNNVQLFHLELSLEGKQLTLDVPQFEFEFSTLTILIFSFAEMRWNICAHSSFAGCGQAFKYFGEAAYWDSVCENKCWKKSIFSWEAQDHCSSYYCSHKEYQSGWLCGMCWKALSYS